MDPNATFIERLLARLIDHAIIFVVIVTLGIAIAIQAGIEFGESTFLGVVIFQCLAAFLYFPLYHSSYLQSTPGKRVFNIYIVNRHGFRVGFFLAAWRTIAEILIFAIVYWVIYKSIMTNLSLLTEDKIHGVNLMKLIDLIPANAIDISHPEAMMPLFPEIIIRLAILFSPFNLILLIESAMMFVSNQKRGLHDMMAGTIVLKRTLQLAPDRFFEATPKIKKRKKFDEVYSPLAYKKATAREGEKKDTSLAYMPPPKSDLEMPVRDEKTEE